MSFQLGKPIGVMLVLALVGGLGIALRGGGPERRKDDLVLWVSAPQHKETYTGAPPDGRPSLVEQFQRRTGKGVRVEYMATRSLDVRLLSLLMSGSRDVPDVVEIEIGGVGKYFRPPVAEVGFLPLNDLLKRSGWMDRIVKNRFAPWSKDGVIFGVPHDVHPVTITYRHDLFTEAGIDLPAGRTWPAFRDACLKFQRYWRDHGVVGRYALELSESSAEDLAKMLLQRHLNVVDADGTIRMTEDKFVETVAFYAELTAGPEKISSISGAGAGGLARDLIEGNLCAFMTPDWRVDLIKGYAPQLAGKMRMMPLPVFEPGDAPTSTWGGTMIAIPRNAKDPQRSWELIELLYFSPEGLAARRRHSGILPPVMTLWDDPIYARADPYFGGQQGDRMFIELARQIPARQVTASTSLEYAYLSKVIVDARSYMNAHPEDHDGLVKLCRTWLADAAEDLRRRVEHSRFEE